MNILYEERDKDSFSPDFAKCVLNWYLLNEQLNYQKDLVKIDEMNAITTYEKDTEAAKQRNLTSWADNQVYIQVQDREQQSAKKHSQEKMKNWYKSSSK